MVHNIPKRPPLITKLIMSEASLFKDVEALVFDVFGTVVDWYGSVIREMTNRSLSSSSEELKQFTEKGNTLLL